MVRKAFGWITRAVALFLVAMMIGTLMPRPFFMAAVSDDTATKRTVLLLSNPIHTDIAFPADADVLEKLSFLSNTGLPLDNQSVHWVILGWGGRAFFIETPTWADLKPRPVFKALTVDQSVMHAALAGNITPDGSQTIAINITENDFDQMLAKALEGFAKNENGKMIAIAGAEYGEFDRFFEGNGAFNAVVGCNTWTASVLRAGGLQTGVWNMLPFNLRASLKLWNECEDGTFECSANRLN